MAIDPRYWLTAARYGTDEKNEPYLLDGTTGDLALFDSVFPTGLGLESNLEPSPDGKWVFFGADQVAPASNYKDMTKLSLEENEAIQGWLSDSSGLVSIWAREGKIILRLWKMPPGQPAELGEITGSGRVSVQGRWTVVSRDGNGSLQGQSEIQLFSSQSGLAGRILLPHDATQEGPTFFDAINGKNMGYITGLQGDANSPGSCTYSTYLNQWSFGPGQ